MMDRSAWLKEMRRDCQDKYDNLWSADYGEKWGTYSNLTHLRFLGDFLGRLPPQPSILDAACGAGRYLPYLLERSDDVTGIDQSTGMLAAARAKFPAVKLEKLSLQDMAFEQRFDGAICMDAMENIPPEEWPLVLGNFQRALKPGGLLYITAETLENTSVDEVKQAYERARQAGLPVVFGEWPDEAVYHYHPSNLQARKSCIQAGFEILQDTNGELYYYHLLLRKSVQAK